MPSRAQLCACGMLGRMCWRRKADARAAGARGGFGGGAPPAAARAGKRGRSWAGGRQPSCHRLWPQPQPPIRRPRRGTDPIAAVAGGVARGGRRCHCRGTERAHRALLLLTQVCSGAEVLMLMHQPSHGPLDCSYIACCQQILPHLLQHTAGPSHYQSTTLTTVLQCAGTLTWRLSYRHTACQLPIRCDN